MKREHAFYAACLVSLLLLLGSSVEFRSLEAKRAEERAERFNPTRYARDFWDHRLGDVLETALSATELVALLNTDMEAAVGKGRTLGQSRVHAYLLKGEAKIVSLSKEGLCASVSGSESDPEILICAGSYLSGNAVRDASGLIDVSDFSDTMKFNRISSEINKIIVEEVIKPFQDKRPQVGMTVRFIGAAEVGEEATQEVPFGGRQGDGDAPPAYHLLKVVPIRLDIE
jgi:predicted lipoprotein